MEQWRLRAEMAFLIDNLQFYLQAPARSSVLAWGLHGARACVCTYVCV